MAGFVEVTNRSRYKDTFAFAGDRGPEFGLIELPEEFQANTIDERVHRVVAAEVGFLDILATRYYGPGYETFWWIIAQANGIIDPAQEMFPGMALRIPRRSRIVDFTSRVGKGQ